MFSFFKKNKEIKRIPWNQLNNIGQVDQIIEKSNQSPVLIFKHSTRCSISTMALKKFERDYKETTDIKFWFLDLIQYREISNEIAERFEITHQSPQVILIKNGKSIYSSSHNGIFFADLINQL